MPGRLVDWPSWPEYTSSKAEDNSDLIAIKQSIIDEYGESSLHQSWTKVCKELAKLTEEISEKGTSSIPEVDFRQLSNLDPNHKQKLLNAGCFVIRNVIPSDQATLWSHHLKHYVTTNKTNVTGWPEPTPFVMNLYYAPSQIQARSHPNQLKVQRELNSWWHDETHSSSPDPLTYIDACRIRPPSTPMLGLGPHIDAGSLSRWADPTYRSTYKAIFEGRPEDYDPYDLSVSQYAKQALFPGPGHSRVLRAFQGWTALTAAGPGEGSLMLYPNIKWSVAYLLLRPFFSPPSNISSDDEQYLDPDRWTFDPKSTFFPGTFRQHSQNLSASSHPHLRLRECLVSIPKMNPGDTVWWHADMCHAVEAEHNGQHDSSVIYIAATPSTKQNIDYVKGQCRDFVQGIVPEDFRDARDMSERVMEKDFVGFTGQIGIMGAGGRKAMGFDD